MNNFIKTHLVVSINFISSTLMFIEKIEIEARKKCSYRNKKAQRSRHARIVSLECHIQLTSK